MAAVGECLAAVGTPARSLPPPRRMRASRAGWQEEAGAAGGGARRRPNVVRGSVAHTLLPSHERARAPPDAPHWPRAACSLYHRQAGEASGAGAAAAGGEPGGRPGRGPTRFCAQVGGWRQTLLPPPRPLDVACRTRSPPPGHPRVPPSRSLASRPVQPALYVQRRELPQPPRRHHRQPAALAQPRARRQLGQGPPAPRARWCRWAPQMNDGSRLRPWREIWWTIWRETWWETWRENAWGRGI